MPSPLNPYPIDLLGLDSPEASRPGTSAMAATSPSCPAQSSGEDDREGQRPAHVTFGRSVEALSQPVSPSFAGGVVASVERSSNRRI